MRAYIIAALSVGTALAGLSGPASADESYPNRPVTIIVPFAAGSGSDVAARIYAKAIADTLKGTAVVENRPGANAMIGAQAVAKAAPDGYTVLMGSGTANAVNYALYADRIAYRPESFATVSVIYATPVALFVQKTMAGDSLDALLSHGKRSGKPLTCGSGNAVTQVACEVLKLHTRADVVTVNYKGNAQSLTDVAGDQIVMAFSDMLAAGPFVSQGRVKALAVAADERVASIPQARTFREQGLAEMQLTAWTAVFVPAGTPAAIVERLNAAARHMLSTPEWVKQRNASAGMDLTGELKWSQQFVAAEVAKWAKYIRETGVKAQ